MTVITEDTTTPLAGDPLLPSQDGVLPESNPDHPVMIKIVDEQ